MRCRWLLAGFAAFLFTSVAFAQTTFVYTGSMQTWTVPAGVNSIRLEARGASGGSGNAGQFIGGLGAIMVGDFPVTPGETLNIVVGGPGGDGPDSMGGGGGGGSFIYRGAIGGAGLMLVAGGGGGAGEENTTNGCDARTDGFSTTLPTGCAANLNDGNGGTGGNDYGGGGGAGWLSDGEDYTNWANSGGTRFAGGSGQQSDGGFGGGGGCHDGGGGGGGYTGGPGGDNEGTGGGAGGSFNAGTNQVNSTGNTGAATVVIGEAFVAVEVPTLSEWALVLFAGLIVIASGWLLRRGSVA